MPATVPPNELHRTSSSTSDSEVASVDSVPSLTSEEEKAMYNELLKEIPVGWCVAKLINKEDIMTFKMVTGNHVYAETFKAPIAEITGRAYHELHPCLLDNDAELLKQNYQVVLTGKTNYVGSADIEEDSIGQATLRIKQVALPNQCVLVVFEELSNPILLKKKRAEMRKQLEDVMDRFLDTMLGQAGNQESKDGAWESLILRNVLSFGDISESDVLVSEEGPNQKESVITAADIGTLIKNLSEAKEEFVDEFLITFRYFITPKSLLNKLILKYISDDGDDSNPIKERLMKVFRAWIKDHFYDFNNDLDLFNTLSNFVNDHCTILKPILSKQANAMQPISDDLASPQKHANKAHRILSMFKKKTKLTDMDATSIAHQLTLLSFTRFKAIKPFELHSQSWSKEEKSRSSPNVVALVEHFNRTANLFAYEILSQHTLKKRIDTLKQIISVGWAAYGYRDFETTFTVVLALSQFVVFRLTETWKELPFTARQQWEKIAKFCDYKDNYKAYRSQLKKSINVMPYMGLFLKDLTNIEENSTLTSIGAVNYFKMRKVAQVISTIQKAQQSIFNFSKDLKILSYIQFEIPTCDENDLWEMSMACERQSDMDRSPSQQRKLMDLLGSTNLVTTSSNPIFGLKNGKSEQQS